MPTIRAERLELVCATPDLLHAAIADRAELARLLNAAIPATWPPDYIDEAALRYTLDRLTESPASAAWRFYFVVLADGAPRTLIGSAGYKGSPGEDGAVEIGYSIVSDRRRRGYATETINALVRNAFAHVNVTRIVAETLPELDASIGVLRRCNFRFLGAGSEPGVIRYELARAAVPS